MVFSSIYLHLRFFVKFFIKLNFFDINLPNLYFEMGVSEDILKILMHFFLRFYSRFTKSIVLIGLKYISSLKYKFSFF